MSIAQVGKTYAFKIFGGGYGACQVLAEKTWVGNRRIVLLLRLNFFGTDPPTPTEIQTSDVALPIYQTHDMWQWATDDCVPWWALEIGDASTTREAFTRTGAVGRWAGVRENARMEQRYHRGTRKPNPYGWRRDAPQIPISLGGATKNYSTFWPNIDLGELLPATGDVSWSGLRALPNLFSLTHAGADRGLIAAMPTLPVLERLNWRAPAEYAIDLRQTRLTHVRLIEVDRAVEIWLPADCAHLSIGGRYDLTTIHAPNTGAGFELSLQGSFAGLPRGIDAVQEVVFADAKRVDVAALARWPELRSLRIRGNATRVENIAALGELGQLRAFDGMNLYQFDAASFPNTGELYEVTIEGLRGDDAKTLRKRLKHLPHASFTKTRSGKWVAENLDNPFRDWDADGSAFGNAARKLWKQAAQAAQATGGTATIEQTKTIVLDLVGGLNKLARRHDIDTLRREQACDAIIDLVSTRLNGALNPDQTQEVVDEARDW